MEKLISICVPVYNGEKYIRETIDMILNQDYKNLEILISDNASTDNTIKEVESISDNRIRIIKNPTNVGMGANWNNLLKLVKGEYLMIVCSDDFLLPGAISAKAAILDANEDVNIVFSSSYVMNEFGKEIFLRRPFKKNQKLEIPRIQKKLFTTKNFFAEPTNIMLRKSAADQTGEFDTSLWYTIDWDYWLRVLNLGNAYYIDKPYSGFRVHSSSATGSSLVNSDKILKDEQLFIEKHKDGKFIPVDKKMINTRERNIKTRLFMKVVFMRLTNLFKR